MNKIAKFQLRERMTFLRSLTLRDLEYQAIKGSQFQYKFPLPMAQKELAIKKEILKYMPKGSFQSLKTTFNYLYPWLPKFTFSNTKITKQITNLQVAITSILMGDFLNRLMKSQNKLVRKLLSDKYLMLTADFFHIKGAVFGSSISKPIISYNMSRIESDLAKYSLKNQKQQLLYDDLISMLQWKSAPYRFGYSSLYALQSENVERISEGQNIGYLKGLLKTLQQYNFFNKTGLFSKKQNIDISDLQPQKLAVILQNLINQITGQLNNFNVRYISKN